MSLFVKRAQGTSTLRRDELDFCINCSSLNERDLDCIAYMIGYRLNFKHIHGMPGTGQRLAKAMVPYADRDSKNLVIVDGVLKKPDQLIDVRRQFKGVNVFGVVIFAECTTPAWISAVFHLW